MPDLALRVVTDGTTADVVVSVRSDHRVAEFVDAVSAHLGLDHSTDWYLDGRPLDRSQTVGDIDVVSGAILHTTDPDRHGNGRSASPGRSDGPPMSSATCHLDVVAGPDAGTTMSLSVPGRHEVGRSATAAVTFSDPTVSRRHATVSFDHRGVAVVTAAPHTANGVRIDGHEVVGSAPLEPGALVSVGATRFTIDRSTPPPSDHRTTDHRTTENRATDNRGLGRIGVRRTPYRPWVVRDHELDPFGPIPERAERRRLHLVAVAAPLVAGVLLYAFTRQLTFLALTVMSPVMMVGSVVEDRRSGRRTERERCSTFRDDLARHVATVERLRRVERHSRSRAAPHLADLVRRIRFRTPDLWPRGRSSPDFLVLRLGLGDDRTRFPVGVLPGGDDRLRVEAENALVGLDRLDDVPVVIDLVSCPVVAVAGPSGPVDGLLSSLVVQATSLHSPADLVVVAIVTADGGHDWLRWLPHMRSPGSPLTGDHLSRNVEASPATVEQLIAVAVARRAGRIPMWPAVLVCVDIDAVADTARLDEFLDLVPGSAMSVVCRAPSPSAVPRQALSVVSLSTSSNGVSRARWWSTDPGVRERIVEVECLRPDLAEETARSMAPLYDLSTPKQRASIPDVVTLFDLLGGDGPSAERIVTDWESESDTAVRVSLGLGVSGPVAIDLVDDGPHTVIGGTSGSGKSELIRSMVLTAAVRHPPDRFTVLFVDYKGGAATASLCRLPHAVGSVTDLDPALASRVLVSLRAELRRRMALLAGRAQDVAGLRRVAPTEAPPLLVIVVDEFATLVREIPDFVSGMIDIAQRGRSLGIHLVLATQRPASAIDDDIIANTNVRVGLRMLDRSESTSVIGCGEAADIPPSARGRGLVRIGPGPPVEFQSPLSTAAVTTGPSRPPVLVTDFDRTDSSPGSAAGSNPAMTEVTQLEVVIDAVRTAHRLRGGASPHRPWCEPLPSQVHLGDVVASAQVPDGEAGRRPVIGLVDEPEHQRLRPATVDLEEGGGLLIVGSVGSGTTTALRTVAYSVAYSVAVDSEASRAPVVVVFDSDGGDLSDLGVLGHVLSVVPRDDPEAIGRHLMMLDREIVRRRRSPSGTSGRIGYPPEPRIIVLIDDLPALLATLTGPGGVHGPDEWVHRIRRLGSEGRRVGVHPIAAAERQSAVPAAIATAMASRLVLRHTDESSLLDHGIHPARLRGAPPGRGILDGSSPVQVAVAPTGETGEMPTLPSSRPPDTVPDVVGVRLGDRVGADSVPAPSGLFVPIGVTDVTGEPFAVDLARSGLTICGGPRSGRSTASRAVVAALTARPAADVGSITVVGGDPPPDRPSCDPLVRHVSAAAAADRLAEVAWAVESDEAPDAVDGIHIVIVDDADIAVDGAVAALVGRLAGSLRCRLVLSVGIRSMSGLVPGPVPAAARLADQLLVLGCDEPADLFAVTGLRLRLRPGLAMRPGRGVLVVERAATVVQVVDASVTARGCRRTLRNDPVAPPSR